MKKYRCTLLIDEEMLIKTYMEGHGLESADDVDIEEVIKNELGWVLSSGIDVIGNLEEIEENKTSISIEWCLQDIKAVVEGFEKSISDSDALVVLEYLEDNHNAEVGINWSVIEEAIHELSRNNTITLF